MKSQKHMLRGIKLVVYSRNAFLDDIVTAADKNVKKEGRAHLPRSVSTSPA